MVVLAHKIRIYPTNEDIVNFKKLEIKLNYDSPTLPEKMRIREQKARLGREYRERNER